MQIIIERTSKFYPKATSAIAYQPVAEPILRQVPFDSLEQIEAKRLLAFLEWFLPLDINMIPDNSILREFIGESNLKDFNLWEQ